MGLLWDAHHTFATSGEEPEFTVKQLWPWIRHTHLKDSVAIDYQGYCCFEWEKVWHPELEDPEVAFADYAQVVGKYLEK